MSYTIRVKCSAGGQQEDKQVTVEGEAQTVSQTKASVYASFNVSPAAKALRLIYSGKLLEPPSALLSSFNIKPDSVVHAVFGPKPVAATPAASVSSGGDVELGPMGAGPGGYQTVAQRDGDASNASGFDRMVAERGMDATQIEAVRMLFAADVTAFASRMARLDDNESEADFRLRAEELFMSSQGPMSDFNLNLPPIIRHGEGDQGENNDLQRIEGFLQRQMIFSALAGGGDPEAGTGVGTYRDLLFGILLGFIFGGIAILCVWDRGMSHRQKMGIIVGVMLSLLINLLTTPTAVPAKST
jgi:hypothetical protein